MKNKVISFFLIIIFLFIILEPCFSQQSDVVIDEAILEPKDPILATVIAIGPGLLAHGFGHFYAEDYKMGLMLFGSEVVSLVVIGAGYVITVAPNNFTVIGGNEDTVKRGGLITLFSGVALFAAGWLVDITTAGRAADQYNIEHNLEFKVQQESNNILLPSLVYNFRF
jgi:hypothetical protein